MKLKKYTEEKKEKRNRTEGGGEDHSFIKQRPKRGLHD